LNHPRDLVLHVIIIAVGAGIVAVEIADLVGITIVGKLLK